MAATPTRPLLAHTTHDDSDLERRTAELLAQSRTADPERRDALLQQVVLLNLRVARSLARRYSRRGESDDDLAQVASLGLVKAAHGFDPSRGETFLAYAVPTVTGELKRHFRDRGWDIRPPRRIQDLRPAVARAREELGQRLGRSPTVPEVAVEIGASEEDVIETLSASSCYAVRSLDAPVAGDDGPRLGDVVPDGDDGGLEDVADLVALEPLLARLPARDRRILTLRYYRGWTQSQIAADVGVTQMQVSRLLTRVLRQLRDELEGHDAA